MKKNTEKLFYHGYTYEKNRTYSDKTYYRCAKIKSSGCSAKLSKVENTICLKGEHTCKKDNLLTIQIPDMSNKIPFDQYIDKYINDSSIKLDLYPHQIYQSLLENISIEYKDTAYKIPSKNAVYLKIRSIRGSMMAQNIFSATIPPWRNLKNGNPFLRRYWSGDVHGDYHQIFIWVTDACLALMRYNGHTFIDATFRVVPAPFTQCLIVMVFDAGTQSFIPCVYCLMTGRNEYLYCIILHELIVLMEYSWMPTTITVDFEKGLIAAVTHEFPQSNILGCYFHFKQSIRRKLLKSKISESSISIILSKIEILTVIPIKEITLGLKYIKSCLNNVSDAEHKFFIYFESTWLKRFKPEIWNLECHKQCEIAGRTNNSLERYNRRLGEFFANAHPNLFSFIELGKSLNILIKSFKK